MFRDQQEYISRVAGNLKEACTLVGASFGYVCMVDGAKIFRKPKY